LPSHTFGADGFTGGTGCNSIQRSFLAHAGRLLAPPPIAIERGCAEPIRSQETRILDLLAAAPRIASTADGRLGPRRYAASFACGACPTNTRHHLQRADIPFAARWLFD